MKKPKTSAKDKYWRSKRTLTKYAHQARGEKDDTVLPKDTKLSHLHITHQCAENMKALRRDMYNNRQASQWDIESSWWKSKEGKRWLAEQRMKAELPANSGPLKKYTNTVRKPKKKQETTKKTSLTRRPPKRCLMNKALCAGKRPKG